MTSEGAGRTSKEILLDKTVEMLEQFGPDGFTIEEVLIESNTSSSSLYHHFGNREGLLTAAREESYRRLARREDRGLLAGGYEASTPEEFLGYVVEQLERIVADPANRPVRRTRLEVAARALGSPELAAKTAHVQDRMFGVIAEMYADAQARGLIDPDLDTHAYALWFHGMVLGWTATESSLDVEAWLSIAIPAVLAPLRLAPASASAGACPVESE